MTVIDGGYENTNSGEQSVEPSLFANMQLDSDFDYMFKNAEKPMSNNSQKLPELPECDIDFGDENSPNEAKDNLSEIKFGSPMEVAQTDLPAEATPLNYQEQELSLRTVGLCFQGTADNPYSLPTGDGRRVLYFTEADGSPVAVQKEIKLIADPELNVPTRQAELVAKRLEFHQLAQGVTARVEMTPPADELRYDHRQTSPKDGYQIFVIDENTKQAYQYSFNKNLNDGSGLRKDLESLKNHYQPQKESDRNDINSDAIEMRPVLEIEPLPLD